MPGSKPWTPKCPYIECIGMDYVHCMLHCFHKNELKFDSHSKCHSYTDEICFNHFDLCSTYHGIYAEEMASNDKRINGYKNCAFCCNSSGYTGLKINHGSTHCYCQKHGIEVENFNPETVCEWFNKKGNSEINNMLDLLKILSST